MRVSNVLPDKAGDPQAPLLSEWLDKAAAWLGREIGEQLGDREDQPVEGYFTLKFAQDEIETLLGGLSTIAAEVRRRGL